MRVMSKVDILKEEERKVVLEELLEIYIYKGLSSPTSGVS